GELQFLENAREDMLRQGMNTHDHVQAPAFKNLRDVADAALMEKLPRLRTKLVDGPVKIFHPVLLVSEHPVVTGDHLRSDRVRLFYRPNDAHRIRLSVEKLLHAGHDRRR